MKYKEEIMSDVFTKHLFDFEGKVEPFHMVVHNFTDIDRGDPHDHPFSFTTHILKGGYTEEIYHLLTRPLHGKYWLKEIVERLPGTSHLVSANCIHKIIDLPTGECWTVIIPYEKVQEPAFYRFNENSIERRYWHEKEFSKFIKG